MLQGVDGEADALTDWGNKVINMTTQNGKHSIQNYDIFGLTNEVSFYRHTREHSERKTNAEGRVVPQFCTNVTPTEEMKQLGVCKLIIHEEKYRDREKEIQEETKEEDKEER